MKKPEIIQQWQSIGRVNPRLLRDEAFQRCKKIGVTNLQSYVTWAELEKRPGIVDFKTYDELVEKLRKHGLRWVPFLISGPHYATPKWFQNSKENVYAKCLEHREESRIQSIWNPYLPKYIDRFLRLFASHYSKTGVIESILLGISGNWGEALYPATGGFEPPPDFHTHVGWWCADSFALQNFQKFLKQKYGKIKNLNQVWQEHFKSFEDVEFPPIRPSLFLWLSKSIRGLIKAVMLFLSGHPTRWDWGRIGIMTLKYPTFKENYQKKRWLDFIEWYLESMNKWADFWLRTARKYFPETDLYLAVGGDGQAVLGADFSNLAKVAARYRAGLRITNQEDDYANTFVLGRWAVSACKFYGTKLGTEEAWHHLPHGIITRIFDAATTGVDELYFKDLISVDIDPKWKRYGEVGHLTPCAEWLKKYSSFLMRRKPKVEVALLLPTTSFWMNPSILTSIYSGAVRLRKYIDLDFLDEGLILDGALQSYKVLLHLEGEFVSDLVLKKIIGWVSSGGIFIGKHLLALDGEHQFSNSREEFLEYGKGLLIFQPSLSVESLERALEKFKIDVFWRVFPPTREVYISRLNNEILCYNSSRKRKHLVVRHGSSIVSTTLSPVSIRRLQV